MQINLQGEKPDQRLCGDGEVRREGKGVGDKRALS